MKFCKPVLYWNWFVDKNLADIDVRVATFNCMLVNETFYNELNNACSIRRNLKIVGEEMTRDGIEPLYYLELPGSQTGLFFFRSCCGWLISVRDFYPKNQCILSFCEVEEGLARMHESWLAGPYSPGSTDFSVFVTDMEFCDVIQSILNALS